MFACKFGEIFHDISFQVINIQQFNEKVNIYIYTSCPQIDRISRSLTFFKLSTLLIKNGSQKQYATPTTPVVVSALGPFEIPFGLSCANALSNSETAAVRRFMIYIYIYIYIHYILYSIHIQYIYRQIDRQMDRYTYRYNDIHTMI